MQRYMSDLISNARAGIRHNYVYGRAEIGKASPVPTMLRTSLRILAREIYIRLNFASGEIDEDWLVQRTKPCLFNVVWNLYSNANDGTFFANLATRIVESRFCPIQSRSESRVNYLEICKQKNREWTGAVKYANSDFPVLL